MCESTCLYLFDGLLIVLYTPPWWYEKIMKTTSTSVGGGRSSQVVRPVLHQSNQIMKRIALLALQAKKSRDPSCKNEHLGEPLLTFMAFLSDRILDYTLSSLVSKDRQSLSLDDVEEFCSERLGFQKAATLSHTEESPPLLVAAPPSYYLSARSKCSFRQKQGPGGLHRIFSYRVKKQMKR